jgi:hypothetical protein
MSDEYRTSIHRPPAVTDQLLLASRNRVLVHHELPTPENPLIISASELKTFLRCRVQWWWRYQCRLEPLTRPPNLAKGTMMHKVLEEWYKAPLRKRTPKRMEALAGKLVKDRSIETLEYDDQELIQTMVVGFAHWVREGHDDDDAGIGIDLAMPRCEQEFDLPLTTSGDIRVRGKLDCVWEPTHLKKTVAVQEYKSASQFRDNHLDNVLQLSVYLWALRALYPGRKRYQAFYTELKKTVPGPRSKADRYRRELVERTDDEIEQWMVDTALAASDMVDAAIYPTPGDSCAWGCDFKDACLLRGNAEDLLHVLKVSYKVRERREKKA